MKKILTLCTSLIFASSMLFAGTFDDLTGTESEINAEIEEYKANIANGFDAFSIDMSNSLSSTATLQNVWADAYIGQFFPSVPMHFGGGVNFGAASLDATGLQDALSPLGMDSYIPDTLAIPVVNADLKIGGIFLPFDLGVSIMKFDTSALSNFNISSLDSIDVDYFSVGANFRYRVLKENILLPNVSIGALYNYTSGSISVGEDDTNASYDYAAQIFGLEAQVSKNFLGILTPFAGGRALVAIIDSEWDYSMEISGAAATAYGSTTISDSEPYTYTLDDYDSIGDLNFQVFAGLGVNLLIFQFTPSVSYNSNNVWAGAFSVHVKL
ncbi:MAG: hypothetical protein BKP49_01335 [Treponema sp. CETP13]|nr:MAG: hypothetical protein BKP49_01335 [Treponema sp. CETP13]